MHPPGQRHFSLIEILVALFILSGSAVYAINGLQVAMSRSAESNDFLKCLCMMEEGLENLRREILPAANFAFLANRLNGVGTIQNTLYYDNNGVATTVGTEIYRGVYTLLLINSHASLAPTPPTLMTPINQVNDGVNLGSNWPVTAGPYQCPMTYQQNTPAGPPPNDRGFPAFNAGNNPNGGLIKIQYQVFKVNTDVQVESALLLTGRDRF